VKPIDAIYNVSQVFAANWEVCGNAAVTFPACCPASNFQNLRLGQLFDGAVFASIMSAVQQFVPKITGSRVVSQVACVVVAWVSVIVATVKTFWSWSNKGQQYKVMNVSCFAASLLVKVYSFPLDAISSLAQRFAALSLKFNPVRICCHAVNAANIAKVGNFVQTLIAGNRLPRFFHVVAPSNAPKCKIHGSQWSDWFSGANLAMSLNYTKEAKNVSF